MSTLMKKNGGKQWEIIISKGEERTRIYLGNRAKKAVELIQSYVDRILDCNASAQPYPPDVASWTAAIDDNLHEKFVVAGILKQRQRRTVGEWIEQMEKEQQGTVKECTLYKFQAAGNRMIEFFGKNTPLHTITTGKAFEYRTFREEKLC